MPVYRGRLIRPLVARIERIDTDETRQAGGYDDDFNTPLISGATGVRKDATRYKEAIELEAQIEDAAFEQQRPSATGDNARSDYTLVFHFETLEALGLVDATTGNALLQKNDRLVLVKDETGATVITPQAGYELYCTEVRAGGGWISKRRNLLIARYATRQKAKTSG